MQKRVRPEHHKHQSHQHLRNNRCDLHLSSTQPDLAPGKLSKLVQLLLKVTLSMARSIAPLPCSPPSHNRSKIPVATIASPTAVAAPEPPHTHFCIDSRSARGAPTISPGRKAWVQ